MKIISFLALFFCAHFAHATDQVSDAYIVAQFDVGPSPHTYRFDVENCANDLAAVKLHVSEAGLHADTIGVIFADKAVKQFKINRTYSAGTESKWLNLGIFRAMDPRCVTQIFAIANSDGGVARVQVWGMPK